MDGTGAFAPTHRSAEPLAKVDVPPAPLRSFRPRPRVVIVGGGFAGLTVAKRLARISADVTLIDRRNHHLFQPLLYQVATAALSPADIAGPIRSILRGAKNVEVLLDEVVGVNTEAKVVLTKDNAQHGYDYLVLATGSVFSYFGHPEWAQYAPGLKSVEDATHIRHKLLLAFEKAETTGRPELRDRLLTFVLVGGGPTGVEMAGAIAELATATLARDFRHIQPQSARIFLIEAGPRLLAGFPEELAEYALDQLRRVGVDVRLNTPIECIDEDGVIAKGERIAASTVVWCAGVRATPVGDWLGVPSERNGAVRVRPDLSLPSHPEIFVLGDAARLDGSDGKPLPGLAAVAEQQGAYLGRLLASRIDGCGGPGPFRYRNLGTMATIGRAAAVADFGRFTMRGFIAWLLWGFVHIYLLIGFRNRTAVFLDWIWSWFTYGRGARLITGGDMGAYSAAPAHAPAAQAQPASMSGSSSCHSADAPVQAILATPVRVSMTGCPPCNVRDGWGSVASE